MRSLTFLARQQGLGASTYQLTDRLHQGRTARVPAEAIASTISGWLAELGAGSPFVEDLARAVRNGDWVHAHAIAEALSVDVTVAA
ncbi:MAG: hypothetical protein WAL26_03045 [Mycobacterium sp.]